MDTQTEIKVTLTIDEIEILMMACDKASNSWYWHAYAKDSKAMNGMYFKALASATEIVRAKLKAHT
jgi:hypothetical protein